MGKYRSTTLSSSAYITNAGPCLSKCGSRSQRLRTSWNPARPVAHGQHVVLPDKHVDFADHQFAFLVEFDGVEHGEKRVGVFLDLRTLMAVLGVFHGKFVQPELCGIMREFPRAGLFQRDPDEAVGQSR